MRTRTLVAPLLFSLAVFGCDDGQDGGADDLADAGTGDSDADGDADADTDADAEEDADADADGTTDGGPLDSDEDGLSDEEEAEIGTDPYDKDTDNDFYWDSWEVIEGTDPLDDASRIYIGYWPYNPNKDDLEQGTWGTASKNAGTMLPRQTFVDQNGDTVDLYDFANWQLNETAPQAYFIFDLSAQWCGPCHNVANWIAGVDSPDTSWIQALYPTVRTKVADYKIWWITYVVENSQGGAPTTNDSVIWFNTHHDVKIPIMSDIDQLMWPAYGSNAYPHFFLVNPDMKIEYFPGPTDSTDQNPYPAVGLVDTLL